MSKESESDAETPETRDIDEDLPTLGPRTVSAADLKPVGRRRKDTTDQESGAEDTERSEAPSPRNRPRTPEGRAFADPLSERQADIDFESEGGELPDAPLPDAQPPTGSDAQAHADPTPTDHESVVSRVRISGTDRPLTDPAPTDHDPASEAATANSKSATEPSLPGDASEAAVASAADQPPPGTAKATGSATPGSSESAGLGHLKSSERKSLLALAAGVLVVALIAFYFLRGALPMGVDRPPIAERFPASGDMFLVKSEGLGWARVDSATERVRLGVEYVPQLNLKVEGSATGALRVVFLNELGRQRGDTVTVSIRNGTVAGAEDGMLPILGTDGLANTLEYNDLRARPELSWRVEIREGADAQGDGRAFRTILRAPIPRDLIAP